LLSEIIAELRSEVKGEIVVLIERSSTGDPAPSASDNVVSRYLELLAGGADRRAALKEAAKESGLSRSDAYARIESQKSRP
jgi:16S rRNA C1402 (ribose-2'-O) methylase RsmI